MPDGLFSFLDMAGNHEQRVVARYEGGKDFIIDTCAVTGSDQPYETGILHPSYNDGDWIVVQMYDDLVAAKKGHKKWVKKMTGKLPESLEDVSTCLIAELIGGLGVYKN